jgi:hypothetical protein
VVETSTQTSIGYRQKKRSGKVVWVHPIIVTLDQSTSILGHTTILSLAGMIVRIPRILTKGQKVKLYVLIDSKWRMANAHALYSKPIPESGYPNLFETAFVFTSGSTGSQLWFSGRSSKIQLEQLE